jgi:hypothetical protein
MASAYEVNGEMIKELPGGLTVVRWVCLSCGEDSFAVFEPNCYEKLAECEWCGANNLVRT